MTNRERALLAVATLLTTKCVGCYTNPNDIGEIPDGALTTGDNIVVSRDGIIEPRRGLPTISTAPGNTQKLLTYGGRLLSQYDSALAFSSADVTTWTPYSGSFPPPSGSFVRSAVANQNLYFTTSTGVKRLDSVTGTPEPAGIPSGLDIQLSLAGAGSAVPTNAEVAYRLLWGKRDANNNLLLGPPSGRFAIANASGSTEDITVSFSIPRSLPSGAFYQLYRTNPSASSTTDPGDEMGLVSQGTAPQPIALSQLSRAGTTVTATTVSAHGYTAGMIVRIPTSCQVAGTFAAVGTSTVAASSPDAITWTSRTIPSGSYNAVAWNGTVFSAVGASVAATSPDAVTWTSRSIPAGTYNAVAWNGSVFVAVGASIVATSPDGTTWTARSIPAGTYRGVAWNGSVFAAVGPTVAATSPDGITWTSRTIPGNTFNAVAWSGTYFAAVGQGAPPFAAIATSPDGITWTLRTSGIGNLSGVAANDSIVVAVGQNGNGFTSTDGVTWTSVSLPGGSNYNAVSWSGSIFSTVGASVAASSPDGTTWTSRSIPAGTYNGVSCSGALFPAGEKTLATASGTTFTYTEAGGAGTVSTSQVVIPITGITTDSVPTGFTGTALYTNATQGTINAAAYMVGGARDLCTFRQTLLYFNILTLSSADVFLLSCGGTSGIANGDTITIDGLVYTAGASENIGTRTFQLSTGGTPSQNILATSQSLIRILNRTQSNTVFAVDLSGPNDPPGHIYLSELSPASSMTVTFSGHASSWSLGSLTPAGQQRNRLFYSNQQSPDAVPLTNFINVGAADQDGLRCIPLRDSTILLKQDGVYRLTGDGPFNFRIDPLDLTVNLLAPETAVALENTVVALTQQGVVRIDDNGVTVISRPIEDKILPLLAPATLSTTAAVSFGIGYESGRKYILGLPQVGDTSVTQEWVYDLFTEAWTRWTLPATAGVVNPADDRLYIANNTTTRQERKTFTTADYADDSFSVTISGSSGASVTLSDATNVLVGDRLVQGASSAVVTLKVSNTLTLDRVASWSNGAASSFRAYAVTVQWSPRFGTNPGDLQHVREVDFLFRNVYFAQATASFSTNLAPSGDSVPLLGSAYAMPDPPVGAQNIRVWLPRNEQRGSRLNITFSQTQAMSQMQLQGIAVVFEGGRERTNR